MNIGQLIIFGLTVFLAGSALATQPDLPLPKADLDRVSELDAQLVGTKAPAFRLPDMSGRQHSLRSKQGKTLLVNFWATFCRPCKEEMPSMEKLTRKFDRRGLEVLAVTQDQKRRSVRSFLSRFLPNSRPRMTVLFDPENAVAPKFGTEKIPETYLVGPDGTVVARFIGAYDWTRPEIQQLVRTVMAGS